MRIITTISRKGGVGKSTSLIGMAMAAAGGGKRSCLIDTDPNEPMSNFRKVGMDNEYWDDNLVTTKTILHTEGGQGDIVKLLEDLQNEGYDYAFVDTKGGEGDFVGYVAQLADIIYVPMALSRADIDGAKNTYDWFTALKAAGLELPPIKFLITQMPSKSRINKSQEFNLEEIRDEFDLSDVEIPINAHMQNVLLYGLFHIVHKELKSADTPQDRIQATHFGKALFPYAELLKEAGQIISQAEIAHAS